MAQKGAFWKIFKIKAYISGSRIIKNIIRYITTYK